MLGRPGENDGQVNNSWLSDEANLSGFVNKLNFRHWWDSNAHLFHETSLHSQKATVYGVRFQRKCNYRSNFFPRIKIFWPLILNDTLQWFVTSVHYNLPIFQCTIFQQDGETSHTARISMNAVNTLFSAASFHGSGICRGPSLSRFNGLWFFFYEGTINQKLLWPIRREPTKPSNNAFETKAKQYPLICCERSRKTSKFRLQNACVSIKIIWRT